MLRALFDGDDAMTTERGQRARRNSAAECGMKQPDASDGTVDHRATNSPRRALDLRQLRHRSLADGIAPGN
jgi:hypothetical protein